MMKILPLAFAAALFLACASRGAIYPKIGAIDFQLKQNRISLVPDGFSRRAVASIPILSGGEKYIWLIGEKGKADYRVRFSTKLQNDVYPLEIPNQDLDGHDAFFSEQESSGREYSNEAGQAFSTGTYAAVMYLVQRLFQGYSYHTSGKALLTAELSHGEGTPIWQVREEVEVDFHKIRTTQKTRLKDRSRAAIEDAWQYLIYRSLVILRDYEEYQKRQVQDSR